MEHAIEVRHVSIRIDADFESFTRQIEQALGRFNPSFLDDLTTDPSAVESRLKQAAGEEGLMLFNVQDHGELLHLSGPAGKAKQYVVGNPLIAIMMTRHDIRAGLYAPLRILVYQAGDHSTQVDFDQPSSLFGQFGNQEITSIARSLDTKLANLIKKAESLAGNSRAA